MRTLVIVPTYNERENLGPLVAAVLAVDPALDIRVVDDNSPDDTGDLAEALASVTHRVQVLHRSGKLGLGTAYLAAFQYALAHQYAYVIEMDADFSHAPGHLPQFLRAIEGPDAADLVIGSRYVPGGETRRWSVLRKIVSGSGNFFARALLGMPIRDCTSGYRCYRTGALARLRLDLARAQGYVVQVEIAYAMWRSGCRIREIPITFTDRQVGHSKMSHSIVLEALRWVLDTRLHGSPVVQGRPAV